MEKLVEKIIGWLQMLFAAFLVAVAAFNCWRVIVGEYRTAHAIMFTVLLGVSIALLVLSVSDYVKTSDEDIELENIKSKNK